MDIGHEPMGRLEYGYASDYIVNQAVSYFLLYMINRQAGVQRILPYDLFYGAKQITYRRQSKTLCVLIVACYRNMWQLCGGSPLFLGCIR
jgi:hypothetical protein